LEPRDRSALQIQQAGADLSDHAALLEGTSLPVLLEDEREERGVGPAADGQERLVRAAEAVESLLDHGMAQYGAGLGVDEDRHVQRIRRSAGGATGVGDHLDTVFEPRPSDPRELHDVCAGQPVECPGRRDERTTGGEPEHVVLIHGLVDEPSCYLYDHLTLLLVTRRSGRYT